MAQSDIKYTHIAIKRTASKDIPCPDRRRHDRDYIFMNHVKTKCEITRADMERMSFNDIERKFKWFTGKYGTKFIYIGNDTWKIVGLVNYKKKVKKRIGKHKVTTRRNYRNFGKHIDVGKPYSTKTWRWKITK